MMRANSYGEQPRWAAFEAVCRGWPVVPVRVGTHPEGVADIQPLIENGDAPVTDADHAWTIWGQQAYGVPLARGRGIDGGRARAVAVAGPPLDDDTSAPPSADEAQRVLAKALRSRIQ